MSALFYLVSSPLAFNFLMQLINSPFVNFVKPIQTWILIVQLIRWLLVSVWFRTKLVTHTMTLHSAILDQKSLNSSKFSPSISPNLFFPSTRMVTDGQFNAKLYINIAVKYVFFQNIVLALAKLEILPNFKMTNFLLIKLVTSPFGQIQRTKWRSPPVFFHHVTFDTLPFKPQI